MGSALLKGFTARGLISIGDVVGYDKNLSAVEKLGAASRYSAFEVVECSDVIFLCVKPKDMGDVLDEIRDIAGSRLIISIAAGISTRKIESKLKEARVIRVMPNTPAVINEMAAAYCLGRRALEEDAVMVADMLSSVGIAFRVQESKMDAVTGLSGSGPAYVYYLIKAMTAAGVKQGLSEEVSLNLTLQTFRGATDMVIVTKRDPVDLIGEVTSPGGTTLAGLKMLDRRKVDKAISDTVAAATKRSRELGK